MTEYDVLATLSGLPSDLIRQSEFIEAAESLLTERDAFDNPEDYDRMNSVYNDPSSPVYRQPNSAFPNGFSARSSHPGPFHHISPYLLHPGDVLTGGGGAPPGRGQDVAVGATPEMLGQRSKWVFTDTPEAANDSWAPQILRAQHYQPGGYHGSKVYEYEIEPQGDVYNYNGYGNEGQVTQSAVVKRLVNTHDAPPNEKEWRKRYPKVGSPFVNPLPARYDADPFYGGVKWFKTRGQLTKYKNDVRRRLEFMKTPEYNPQWHGHPDDWDLKLLDAPLLEER